MRKKIAVLAAMLIIVSTALFAVDFKAVVGQQTSASLEFEQKSPGGEVSPRFLFNIDAELDMDFSEGHGMLVRVNPFCEGGGSVEFGLGVGYAYQDWISNSTSLIVGVGPNFIFGNSGVGFGLFATVDFDFHITSSMFVRVGTGVHFDLGEFGDKNFGRCLNLTIPLPHLGFGWEF